MNPSLNPIAESRFDYLAARHLLHRAGFGGTPEQIQDLAALGPGKAVDFLVDYDTIADVDAATIDPDADIMKPLTPEQRQELRKARQENDEAVLARYRAMRNQAQADDRKQLADLRKWWFARMVETPRPLEEKLTLLWHDHFATSYRGCEDSYLLYQQNQFFRDNAAGSFADLATGIVRDPAMIVYLNNDRNYRRKPNENLARELMELFTLGEGNYTERDIQEGARALTGYFRDDNDFAFRKGAHDPATKSILGVTAAHDGESFVRTLLRRRACSEFVAWKLYRHFVADVNAIEDVSAPQRRVVAGLATELRRSNYQLKPVLKMLFASEHFYDPAVRAAKIKSPVELVVGMIRVLRPPQRDVGLLLDAMRTMGQDLFAPPNVAGWPGGRTWINTATLFVRQNLATYLITGRPPFESDWERRDINYDATWLSDGLARATPDAVIDRMLDVLLGDARNDARRKQLRRFLADHEDHLGNDMLIGLLCLITAMPEYQLT